MMFKTQVHCEPNCPNRGSSICHNEQCPIWVAYQEEYYTIKKAYTEDRYVNNQLNGFAIETRHRWRSTRRYSHRKKELCRN